MNAGCQYLAVTGIYFGSIFIGYLYDPRLGIYNI